MKLTIPHSTLNPVVSDLASIASGPSPAARAIRISIKEKVAILSSSDGDSWLEMRIACDTADAEIAVDAPVLHSVISGGFGDVTLEAADRLTIRMGAGKYRLPLIPAADTAARPTLKAKPFLLSGDGLKAGLKAAILGVADKSHAKLYAQGVHMIQAKDKIRFTGSDGNRMAVVNIPAPSDCPEALCGAGIIIPAHACKSLLRLIETGTVAIRITETLAEFDCGDATLVTKLIDDKYPPALDQVLKMQFPTVMEIPAADILAAVNRLMPLADQGGMNGGRAMHFRALSGTVSLSVVSDIGAAVENIETETPIPVSLGFNGVSLKLALSSATGTARFEFHEDFANKPCRLTFTDRPDLIWILCSVRVREPMMAEAA